MQKICIVIPCYNEEKRLPVNDFLKFYNENPDIHFCFANDGSKDGTIQLLQQIRQHREERILIVDIQPNGGKAEAVRKASLQAIDWKPFDYVGYFDADFATPLEELNYFLFFNQHLLKHSIIMGSRVKRMGATIERSPKRHYMGRIFSTVASLMLNLPIYDTQCGAKLIKSEIIKEIFIEPFISRWLFDVEIFARIVTLYGYEKASGMIQEIPLNQWIEKGDSRLKTSFFFKVPLELFKIYRKYRLNLRTSNL